MEQQSTSGGNDAADMSAGVGASALRAAAAALALESALRKRRAGVPTYTIPETAAVLSVSHEHLYRQVRRGLFPALRLNGRYVIPAQAVEDLLTAAASAVGGFDLADWTTQWQSARGGAA